MIDRQTKKYPRVYKRNSQLKRNCIKNKWRSVLYPVCVRAGGERWKGCLDRWCISFILSRIRSAMRKCGAISDAFLLWQKYPLQGKNFNCNPHSSSNIPFDFSVKTFLPLRKKKLFLTQEAIFYTNKSNC